MYKIVTVSLMVMLASPVMAQKVIKLPAELKAVKPMVAAPRGISTIPKYRFGPYEIASGKAGWVKGKSKSKGSFFLRRYEEFESSSKQKLSFVFVGNKSDSVLVNAAINNSLRTTEMFGVTALQESKQNFIAELTMKDTVVWSLAFTKEEGLEVENNYQVSGKATNGTTDILFHPVTRWADGSKSITDMIIGYVFYVNDKPIGAVQASLNTFHKKYVWIADGLPSDLKLSVAGIAATVYVMTDMQQAQFDND